LRAHLPHWEELIHVAGRARRIASLDLDLAEPTTRLADDPLIGPLLRHRPGLRPPGSWDPFETGVRAIVGQPVTHAAAKTIAGRIVQRHGTPVPGLAQFGLSHTFPSAATLATADLGGLGLTRSRAAAISAFALAVERGLVRLDRSVSIDRLVASITDLEGLGPWTAHYIALRLGEPDAFPTTNLGVRHAPLARLPEEPTATLGQRWRPWRAVATTHLWFADAAGVAPPADAVRGAA
jgi:AraC family transcriptional regulator of adaptative response / DNA-3-methyladenine glycosylase II